MTIKLEFSEKERQDLVEFYQHKIQVTKEQFQAEIERLENKIIELNGAENSLRVSEENKPNPTKIISRQTTKTGWRERIETILRAVGTPLTSGEIYTHLQNDPDVKAKGSAFKSITSVLAQESNKSDGKFKKEKKDKKYYFKINE